MDEPAAKKIVAVIEKICEENEIWHDIQYLKHPHPTMIKFELSIKIAPKHTRKMEIR